MRARDIMTSHVVTVGPGTDVHDIARLLLEKRISAVPVIDADRRVLGIVSEGDLMRRPENATERHPSWWLVLWGSPRAQATEYVKHHGQTARDVMTTEVVTVGEDTPVGEIAELLEAHRVKRVPVVRDGRLVGIVSRANLLHGLASRRGAPPSAPTGDDRALRERVQAALQAELGVTSALVNVTVSGGVVELWGEADSETERNAIVVAARNAAGGAEVRIHVFVPSASVRSLNWGV